MPRRMKSTMPCSSSITSTLGRVSSPAPGLRGCADDVLRSITGPLPWSIRVVASPPLMITRGAPPAIISGWQTVYNPPGTPEASSRPHSQRIFRFQTMLRAYLSACIIGSRPPTLMNALEHAPVRHDSGEHLGNTGGGRSMHEHIIDGLRRAYAAFSRGDIQGAIDAVEPAPDILWIEPEEFYAGGTYHG